MTIVYLDLETTGLDWLRHDIVEVAWAVDDGPISSGIVQHTLDGADLAALKINRYYERDIDDAWSNAELLPALTRDLIGATVVGSNPAFDTAFLRRRIGFAPWHHRLFDISAYAAGVFGESKLLGQADIVKRLRDGGFEIPEPDHTAAGDVESLRRVHLALIRLATTRIGVTP